MPLLQSRLIKEEEIIPISISPSLLYIASENVYFSANIHLIILLSFAKEDPRSFRGQRSAVTFDSNRKWWFAYESRPISMVMGFRARVWPGGGCFSCRARSYRTVSSPSVFSCRETKSNSVRFECSGRISGPATSLTSRLADYSPPWNRIGPWKLKSRSARKSRDTEARASLELLRVGLFVRGIYLLCSIIGQWRGLS